MTKIKMKVFVCGLVFLVLSAPVFAGQGEPQGNQYGHISHELDVYFRQLTEAGSFSGSVLIASKGKVLLKKGYGMANYEEGIANTPETLFAISSMTKAFTAMGILILEERGFLSVNDTIDKFIPEYPDGHLITIHHLLNHTSGIYLYLADPVCGIFFYQPEKMADFHTPSDLLDYFMYEPLYFEPGSQWMYCNPGYVVLGVIIERASGLTYGEFIKANILEPLNMKHTIYDPYGTAFPYKTALGYYDFNADPPTYDIPWSPSILFSAGGIYSTVKDLYKWDQALYTNQLVSYDTLTRMFTPYSADYGYGWVLWELEHNGEMHKYIQHSGAFPGYHSMFIRMIDDKITIIILENFPTYIYGGPEHFDLVWICEDVAHMVLDSQ